MAVQQGYGKMAGANSLVFAYDTGDTVNSYKGEPTTNILNNNILAYGGSLGEDSFGTFVQLANDTTGYSRFQLPSIPVSSNDTYTWSFELYTSETFTTGYSWDTNEYSEQFPNSNDLSRLTYTHSTPSTISANTWTPFRLTVTMKDGLTGAYTYDFFRFFFPTFQNKKVYYRNMQFEFKGHKTQYVGQGGTRSVTEGLKDLTGNQTVNLTNVSFDNNAQIGFDGTNDYIDLGSDITIKSSGGWSVESVVYYDSVAGGYNNVTSPANFIGSDSITYNSWYWSVLNSKLALWNRSPGVWKYGSTTIQPDTWYHAVLVSYDSGTSYQMYLNGVAEGGDHTTYSWNASYSGLKVRYIGRGNQSNTRLVNGNIPITKLYNKALTAAEVKANFNNYKTRFNIE
jgi:hypothetical protein